MNAAGDEPTLKSAMLRVLGDHSAPLVTAFYDPANRFAGSTFDTLPPNDPHHFAPADVLAASLLDVGYLPRAVRALLIEQVTEFDRHLTAIRPDVDLWEASDADLDAALRLWRTLRTLDGVGPTRASKLMARKRPRLIPVVDGTIRDNLPVGADSWRSYRSALDSELIDAVERLRPEGLSRSVVPTLRLLDAALWMNLSGSVHVTTFRDASDGE